MNAITVKSTRLSRRLDVVLNYSTLIIMLTALFSLTRQSNIIPIIAVGLVAALFFVISFINLFVKTKLWKFVHTKIDDLDEREVQVIFQSLRQSYTIFAIVSPTSLLYFAHSAPVISS